MAFSRFKSPPKNSSVGYFRVPATVVLPPVLWFFVFLLAPLCLVLAYSLSRRGTYGGVLFELNLDNYTRAFEWIYLKIFLNSLFLALTTAVSCLLIGYPMACVMATATKGLRSLLMILVVVPFWTNFVVRAFAIKVFLGPLSDSPLAVWIGMVTNYLPFMVLPLYVSLEGFDFTLIEAARDLGASYWSSFWRVLVPLTKKGIVTGLVFVFTPALGEFVIPDILGGARTMLIGNLITEQFLKARDWPFGSALSLLMIAIVMVCLVFYRRFERDPGEGADPQ